MRTPTKAKRQRTEYFDGFSLTALRNIIHSMHTVRKEIPTMRKILAAAKVDLNYTGSETTLRKRIKSDLGYRFKRCYQKRLALIERPQIQAWRAKYLRRMKQNDSLDANKRPVIYLDETWIHAHYTVKKCWQTATDVGVRRNDSPGRRWIIVYAGSETGFVDNALLMPPALGRHQNGGLSRPNECGEFYKVAYRIIITQYTTQLHDCGGQRPLSQ
ncbi:jg2407 [Pararge aegeria aegeria]|uniref:Jg2407 protein n=1 Tax=Pararge aegeria aegeria TaxID=348720 RepID=A0A8S4R073_9NEOP|nr:jg2407 [Pararge aegeria aegeria]